MDQNGLREKILAAIDTVKWLPDWGQQRMLNMMATRPDWCISRQRIWGVPMCLLVDKDRGDLHPNMVALLEKIALKIEQHGIDAWDDLDLHELIGKDADRYVKVKDILDVWFDSGVSHYCVLENNPQLQFPADLYSEGSDQYRGWFNSSLTTSCAMNGTAPYRQILTHGFTVDADGHKMSKSLGNVIAPEKLLKTYGADIIRLWTSSVDYQRDIVVSEEAFKHTVDAYRRIRNTARFMLSNLNDFDLTKTVSKEKLLPLDRWAIGKAFTLQEEIKNRKSVV
jgi:isoleucyl-tRNA synthetase